VDITWLVGVALIAAAAWAPERDQQDRRDRTLGTGALLAIPVAFASSSVVLLMVASLSGTFQNAAVIWLAGASVLLALARTALTFREVRHPSEARLQARTDELTGLPNQRDFLERLSSLTERTPSAEGTSRFAVLLLDLDRFEEVNDGLGHPVGDDLLRLIGPRLAQSLTRGGHLARMGGDEFGVLLPGADEAGASRVAHDMNVALRETFHVGGMPLHIDASIGIPWYPSTGPHPRR